jgi:hypothetical protein
VRGVEEADLQFAANRISKIVQDSWDATKTPTIGDITKHDQGDLHREAAALAHQIYLDFDEHLQIHDISGNPPKGQDEVEVLLMRIVGLKIFGLILKQLQDNPNTPEAQRILPRLRNPGTAGYHFALVTSPTDVAITMHLGNMYRETTVSLLNPDAVKKQLYELTFNPFTSNMRTVADAVAGGLRRAVRRLGRGERKPSSGEGEGTE